MSCHALRGFCPAKTTISGIFGRARFGNTCISFFFRLQCLQKWLSRPNHYDDDIRSKILYRTLISFLKYFSPRHQNLRKTSNHSFLAWMSTWISKWRRRWLRRPNNSPIWPETFPIACRNEISRSGIPLFDEISVFILSSREKLIHIGSGITHSCK